MGGTMYLVSRDAVTGEPWSIRGHALYAAG